MRPADAFACSGGSNPRSSSTPPEEHWFVAHTHHNAEKTASLHLDMQGFANYLPMRRRTVRHARRIYETTEAFFPGYLFVKLDPKRSKWRSINSTIGVSYLLRRGEQPLRVERGFVETLQSATGSDGILRLMEGLRPGQKVRIQTGTFADYLGRLERCSRADAVCILIEMMERSVPVYVAREAVIAIPE